MFRYKKRIKLPYNRQGYIYFVSLTYKKDMSEDDREIIRKLCQKSAGQYWQALLEFVTTEKTATRIEQEYFLSKATLYRCLIKYYMNFPRKL